MAVTCFFLLSAGGLVCCPVSDPTEEGYSPSGLGGKRLGAYLLAIRMGIPQSQGCVDSFSFVYYLKSLLFFFLFLKMQMRMSLISPSFEEQRLPVVLWYTAGADREGRQWLTFKSKV